MPSPDPRGSRALTIAALALAALMVGSLWIVDYLPTSDGPNHVLAGWLSVHLHDPGKGYDAFVEPGGPVSSLAFHGLFTALLHVMSWRAALRVTLSVGASLWAFGFASLVAALRRERAVVGLFGFATALSWLLYMGLFSYWMTLGIDLAILAFAIRRPDPSLRDHLVLAAALALAMVAHSFAAALLGLMLGVLAIVRPGPRGRLRALAALALASAPSLAIAALSARSASRALGATASSPLEPTWLPWSDRFDILWQCFTGGPAWRGAVPLVLGVAGIGLLVHRARRGRATRAEIAVGAIAASMLVAVLVSPIHLSFWQDVSPRFLPLGLGLGIALLPFEELEPARHRAIAAVGIAVFAALATGWSWVHHARLALASADLAAILEAPVRRHGARLPIVLAPPEGSVAQVEEHVLAGDLFAVEQGGMTPYLYATRPGVHPFVWKRPRTELFPRFPSQFYGQLVREAATDPSLAPRPVHLAVLGKMGAAFEDVILWGTPADVRAFEARGYVADAARGGAAILRFVPCGLDVDVEVGDAARPGAPVAVEYGWAPLVEPAGSRTLPKESVVDGKARASFPEAPCGPVWVRALRDEEACAGADPAGRLGARTTRAEHAVRCALAARR